MILLTYGTRPEWIKILPIIENFKRNSVNFKVLFTGQHETINDGWYNYRLEIPKRSIERLNNIFASIISSKELEELNPSAVLVQGDTASVFAIALKYFNLKIPVIHLEAGLRTYDLNNPFPEEAYRQMVSRIASIHLCPTEENKASLEIEKCSGDKYVVGNTVLDNLSGITPTYSSKVLCTFHRRENHELMDKWFTAIEQIANLNPELEFVLPIHPNPNVLKHKEILKSVKVVEPMKHNELVQQLKDVKAVITDSGGIQEEATFLQKRVIVCRIESERAISDHITLCPKPENLPSLFNSVISNYMIDEPCPFGDGKSSERIYNILSNLNLI
jgi:UDP-N-acetylglucosamine 2-epimerase (non-hydrolysing)